MERETKTITTPIEKHTVVIKTYLTGGEKRAINNAAIPQRVNYEGSKESINDINLVDVMNAGEDAVLKNIIVSINGNSNIDFVKTVLDMRSEDSDFVLSQVKEVADGLTEEKKTA
jgi:hypothetical protein